MGDEPGAILGRRYRFGASRRTVAAAAGCVLLLLVGLRAMTELAMMDEFGNDAQMGIWQMFMIGEVIFWLLTGGLALWSLVAWWPRRWGSIAGLVVFALWAIAICHASWSYNAARQALADAQDSSAAPARLLQLVDFAGIQAGYRLDNRLASNPSTPTEALRRLCAAREYRNSGVPGPQSAHSHGRSQAACRPGEEPGHSPAVFGVPRERGERKAPKVEGGNGSWRRFLRKQMSALGYSLYEPVPIPAEEPELLPGMVSVYRCASGKTIRELDECLGMSEDDFRSDYLKNLTGIRLVG